MSLIKFLHANNLTQTPAEGGSAAYTKQAQAKEKHWFNRALHGYLFFKIPIFRPQRFLEWSYPLISFVYGRIFLFVVCLLSLCGLYMAARQWDEFWATFLHFFSLEGLVAYGVALIFIKVLHELGHAYSAVRYKCRVLSIGVAFMVLFPLLYTDVSDAWRLKDRKKRLLIDASGIGVELIIAGLATFAWAFLPDGPARSGAFFLATTSWVLSLFVNLNPFMRFDGYHLLVDGSGVANLQNRAFAHGEWFLREVIFGLGDEKPEPLPPGRHTFFLLYAYGTWIYRFFLFLGIALLIYHLTFKVLGVFLAAVEIFFFIAKPIFNEMAHWWSRREDILKTGRFRTTLVSLLVVIALLFIPWPLKLALPGLLQPQNQAQIAPPIAAEITGIFVKPGDEVVRGQRLLSLRSHDLEQRLTQTKLRIDLLNTRLNRQTADADTRSNLRVLARERIAEENRFNSIRALQQDLDLKSPLSGRVTTLDQDVRPGDFVPRSTPLIFLAAQDGIEILSYVPETERNRLKEGALAHFVPADPALPAFEGVVIDIAEAATIDLKNPYFQSTLGGAIAVEVKKDGQNSPVTAIYEVRIQVQEADITAFGKQALRGTVHVDADPESVAERMFKQIAKVILREFGL